MPLFRIGETLKKLYSDFSLIFTNFLLLVVGLNLLLWGIFAAHDAAQSHTSEIYRWRPPSATPTCPGSIPAGLRSKSGNYIAIP
jgi:hypothetical protein